MHTWVYFAFAIDEVQHGNVWLLPAVCCGPARPPSELPAEMNVIVCAAEV